MVMAKTSSHPPPQPIKLENGNVFYTKGSLLWDTATSVISHKWFTKHVMIKSHNEDIKNTKFVVSPPGLGEDCYRTWEAILLWAIPIVRSSNLDPLFQRVPALILKDWEFVNKKQLLSFRPKNFSRKWVIAQYWFDRINSFRKN